MPLVNDVSEEDHPTQVLTCNDVLVSPSPEFSQPATQPSTLVHDVARQEHVVPCFSWGPRSTCWGIEKILTAYLEARPHVGELIASAVRKNAAMKMPSGCTEEIRQVLWRATGQPRVRERALCPIQGMLLRALACVIHDLGDDLGHWFTEGAPAGVTRSFELSRAFAP
eukprot:4479366-Amphidinium_carterae.1